MRQKVETVLPISAIHSGSLVTSIFAGVASPGGADVGDDPLGLLLQDIGDEYSCTFRGEEPRLRLRPALRAVRFVTRRWSKADSNSRSHLRARVSLRQTGTEITRVREGWIRFRQS